MESTDSYYRCYKRGRATKASLPSVWGINPGSPAVPKPTPRASAPIVPYASSFFICCQYCGIFSFHPALNQEHIERTRARNPRIIPTWHHQPERDDIVESVPRGVDDVRPQLRASVLQMASDLFVWHLKRMQHIRQPAVAILTTALLLVFVMPLFCLAQPMGMAVLGSTPGGCHGHHRPMPLPTHRCCYAKPQLSAQVRLVSLQAVLNVVLGRVERIPSDRPLRGNSEPTHADLSPPLSSVLRI